MSHFRIDRRGVLSTAAAVGLGAALAPAAARALRIEDDPVAERLYLSACETRAAHEQLVQDLMAQLEEQEGRAKAAQIVSDTACPVCGCKLGAVAAIDGGG